MIFKYEHSSLGVYVCIIMILYVHEMRYIYYICIHLYSFVVPVRPGSERVQLPCPGQDLAPDLSGT